MLCKCGKPALDHLPVCLDCWLKRMSYKNGYKESPDQWIGLKKKLEQQGSRCAYTHEVLVPGVNASIDHIVPRAKGGTSSLDNLQWVAKKVNISKRDIKHEDFVEMCCKVAKHSKERIF